MCYASTSTGVVFRLRKGSGTAVKDRDSEMLFGGWTMFRRYMRFVPLFFACLFFASVVSRAGSHTSDDAATTSKTPAANGSWSAAAASRYLDAREIWWQQWPHAQKDHGTVCISCHTQVPYALARPALRRNMHSTQPDLAEQTMLASIRHRVALGDEAVPFYTDAENGPGKTLQARNAEQVFNALILASADASHTVSGNTTATTHLSPLTRTALDRMWTTQVTAGPQSGAWVWQDFHYSPWEAPESEYFGATMAALAVAVARTTTLQHRRFNHRSTCCELIW